VIPNNHPYADCGDAAVSANLWRQAMIARTLNEMTRYERSNMVLLVAQALDTVGDEAEDRGDSVSANNANYLAKTLRGCGISSSEDSLKAAEILLEQGISYVASLSDRFEDDLLHPDEADEVADERSFNLDLRVYH
jgi:hypothetical protein